MPIRANLRIYQDVFVCYKDSSAAISVSDSKYNMMIAWIKKQIRMYFGFSKRETNGVLLLLLITTIAVLVPFGMYCYDRLCRAERGDKDGKNNKNNLVIVESKFYKRKEGDRLKKVCNLPQCKIYYEDFISMVKVPYRFRWASRTDSRSVDPNGVGSQSCYAFSFSPA